MKKNGLWSSCFAGLFVALLGGHIVFGEPGDVVFSLPPIGGWVLLCAGSIFALRAALSLWIHKGK